MARRVLTGPGIAAWLAASAAFAGPDGVESATAPLDVSKLSLDPAGIRAVIGHHLPALRACYELALADGGRAGGKVMLDFSVGPRGRVELPTVREIGDGLRHPPVVRCLEQVLSAMEFPRPADGEPQPIHMPLILTPVE